MGSVKSPENYSGENPSDVRMYFRNFDKIADANNWTQARRKTILPAFLTGRAAQFLDSVDTTNMTFGQIKERMIEHFSPASESGLHWCTLERLYQQPGQTVDNFIFILTDTVHKAYPNERGADLAAIKLKYFMYHSLPHIQQILLMRQSSTDDV